MTADDTPTIASAGTIVDDALTFNASGELPLASVLPNPGGLASDDALAIPSRGITPDDVSAITGGLPLASVLPNPGGLASDDA